MNNLEINDLMNHLGSQAQQIDSRLMENIMHREPPSFSANDMPNSASSSDINPSDMGVDKGMIDQLMKKFGIGYKKNPLASTPVSVPAASSAASSAAPSAAPVVAPAVAPAATPSATPAAAPSTAPAAPVAQVLCPMQEMLVPDVQKFSFRGYSIPKHTLYLIVILVLVSVGIYFVSRKKKPVVQENDDDLDNQDNHDEEDE